MSNDNQAHPPCCHGCIIEHGLYVLERLPELLRKGLIGKYALTETEYRLPGKKARGYRPVIPLETLQRLQEKSYLVLRGKGKNRDWRCTRKVDHIFMDFGGIC